MANLEQKYQQTAQQTKETAAAAADTVAKSALWGFFAIVIGAVVAAIGGVAGRPKNLLVNA